MSDINKECGIVKPGQTDSGRMMSGTVWQVASAALLAVNTAISYELSKKQFDLAMRYYQISRSWRDWYNTGFAPLEDKELDEVIKEPAHPAYYDTAIGRASALFKLQIKESFASVARCTSQYDSGLRATALVDMSKVYGTSVTLGENYGYRGERAHFQAMDDLRWGHKETVMARGRNMIAQNAVYGDLAAGIYDALNKRAGEIISDLNYFLGYAQRRTRSLRPEDSAPKNRRSDGKNRNTGKGSDEISRNYFDSMGRGAQTWRAAI
jgi:hypothetical protein